MLKPQALLSDASASIVFINIAAMIDITIAVSCIGADGGSASGLQRSLILLLHLSLWRITIKINIQYFVTNIASNPQHYYQGQTVIIIVN